MQTKNTADYTDNCHALLPDYFVNSTLNFDDDNDDDDDDAWQETRAQ